MSKVPVQLQEWPASIKYTGAAGFDGLSALLWLGAAIRNSTEAFGRNLGINTVPAGSLASTSHLSLTVSIAVGSDEVREAIAAWHLRAMESICKYFILGLCRGFHYTDSWHFICMTWLTNPTILRLYSTYNTVSSNGSLNGEDLSSTETRRSQTQNQLIIEGD